MAGDTTGVGETRQLNGADRHIRPVCVQSGYISFGADAYVRHSGSNRATPNQGIAAGSDKLEILIEAELPIPGVTRFSIRQGDTEEPIALNCPIERIG